MFSKNIGGSKGSELSLRKLAIAPKKQARTTEKFKETDTKH